MLTFLCTKKIYKKNIVLLHWYRCHTIRRHIISPAVHSINNNRWIHRSGFVLQAFWVPVLHMLTPTYWDVNIFMDIEGAYFNLVVSKIRTAKFVQVRKHPFDLPQVLCSQSEISNKPENMQEEQGISCQERFIIATHPNWAELFSSKTENQIWCNSYQWCWQKSTSQSQVIISYTLLLLWFSETQPF